MAAFKQDQCVQRVGNQTFLSRLSEGLNQMRQQASFCDVNIFVGDQRFPAHKAVLSSASDYFQGMFSSGFQEKTLNEISVPGTGKSFAQILDFAYTGYFMLSLETVTDIFKMASFMVFTEAVDVCAEYLKGVKDQLAIGDCFEIWSIARNHSSLTEIAKLYQSHLVQNILKCVKSEEFLKNSSACVMMEFLSDEEIETDTTTEEHILEAVMTWLKFDWEHRKVHVVDLLKKVRLGLVPLDRLRKICGYDLLAIPECKNMVEEVVKLSVTKETASPPLVTSHPEFFASRNTITATISVDREDFSSTMLPLLCTTDTACYQLSKVPDVPNKLPFMEMVRQIVCMGICVTDNGHLYAARGDNKEFLRYKDHEREKREAHLNWTAENNFYRYDSERNEWILLPPMPILVCFPKVVCVDDCIYVTDSKDTSIKSGTLMLKYSIPNKTWTVEAEDKSLSVTHVAVFEGNILIQGESWAGFGYELRLYKPHKKLWLPVTIDGTLDLEFENSRFSVHEGICYVVTGSKVNRVIFEFDGDEPTMVIAEALENPDPEIMDIDPKFTFDKRRVGLELFEDCDCDSHVKES